jgi:ferredoxin
MYDDLISPEPLRRTSQAQPRPATPESPGLGSTDLLRWPVIGRLLRWRHLRTATRLVLLVAALAVVAHGLFGQASAPTNLATVATWIHYRGLLIGAILVALNAFCHACPMMLARDWARRVHAPRWRWPRALRGKWLALPLFAGVLFALHAWDLWSSPRATAWLIVGYFGGAILVDTLFTGAAFCKHVCPVGQFGFVASTLSPLEIRRRDADVCAGCRTVDCLKGRRAPETPSIVVQRGCELRLFVPAKQGNLECTFCLDCVHACPHDNVALAARIPGDELADDRRRSVAGRLSRRLDLALLAMLFTFGGLLTAFAATAPMRAVEARVAYGLGLGAAPGAVGLAVLFAGGLVVVPLLLCGLAAMATQALGGPLGGAAARRVIAASFVYALVPLGAGIWAAHHGFVFLTAAGAIVPAAQAAAIDLFGWAPLGQPDRSWLGLGLRPGLGFALQVGAVILGGIGSTSLIQRIALRDYRGHAAAAGVPWVVLTVGLTALAIWIFFQALDAPGSAFLP